jgi:hypothetical protein
MESSAEKSPKLDATCIFTILNNNALLKWTVNKKWQLDLSV